MAGHQNAAKDRRWWTWTELLLLGEDGPWGVPWAGIGEVGLWAAAVLTLVTGYDYLRSGLRHIAGSDAGNGGIRGAGAPESKAGEQG